MSFTSEVILYCLVFPGLVAGVFGCVATVVGQKLADDHREPGTVSRRGGLFAALGWCVAMVTAMGLRQWSSAEGFSLDVVVGAEAWQQVIWPMFLFAGVLAVHRRALSDRSDGGGGRYAAAGMAACAVAFVALPRGDGWTDLLPLHRPWFALTVVSCLANAWCMERLVRAGGERWVLLVLLAGLGGPALLGSLNYAAPAEWTFAAIAASAACLLVLWGTHWLGKSNAIWTVVYPGSVVIASMTTTARFYTYEDYPFWVYTVALFLPAIVVMVDAPLRRHSWKIRVPIAAVASAAMIGGCVWQLVLSQPADNW